MPELRNKTNRLKLKPRAAIYPQVLAEGRALGYRRRRSNRPGRWVLRTAKSDSGYNFEVLGIADDFAPADGREILDYSQALTAALGRKSADPTKVTVQQAMTSWADAKAETASSTKQAADYHNAARRISSNFGRKTLKTISAKSISDWLKSLTDGQKKNVTILRKKSFR